ncbi:Glutamine--fructose-6-phosphate aminotransferase [isomerizing] [Streptomyces lavendulae subsp. lavendulae]|uniref:Glutamine--fructose-6-phosphate aminotransferase [isomerizing] n=1 Tax=Streptomyces lavendulae subsp. lavendulae TaxID=58340 RepID=A0A2K8PRU7_STRLA|nr:sugar isomerase [Streptomyces lavendulae]ATZ22109.1 Glutamine--fructose-6-phosphate aminotransferase [isomerizing] [Streptomyces lavendulae subsp. lavendulae]ATZ29462.1 Glutamine--fructose-6-phosphate aminotransferase [isomerizing] [Streptomyces lavendulae subsp. lavendulae]
MSTPPGSAHTSHTSREIASQPDCWRMAAASVTDHQDVLPRLGERVAVVGCGTSWFMALAYAELRERAGQGETDSFAASRFPAGRRYDRIVALTRSGTTTEVLDLLARLRGQAPVTAVTADAGTPVADVADGVIELAYADEKSVVQTRFATTTFVLLRAHLESGGPLPRGVRTIAQAAADAERAVAAPLPEVMCAAEQITFLGDGWAYGLALEAGLKMREAAGAWTEAYPAMEYRHGPISIARPGRGTWVFGPAPHGLADDVARTGVAYVAESGDAAGDLDPLSDLVRAQRLAVHLAGARGLDPDRPRALSRSVVLAGAHA